MSIARRVVSPVVVVIAFVAGGFALAALTTGCLDAVTGPNVSFDALVTLVGAVIAWAVYGYLALGAVLTLLASLPGAIGATFDAIGAHVTPAAYRRVAQVALGLTVIAGPAFGTAAQAAPNDAPTSVTAVAGRVNLDRPGTPANSGSRVDLDRPANPTSPARTTQARPSTTDPLLRPIRDHAEHSYTVVRGDCLWDIAAARLPAGASATAIDTEWRRWYAANRAVIGDNPDLIHPGQVFTPPG